MNVAQMTVTRLQQEARVLHTQALIALDDARDFRLEGDMIAAAQARDKARSLVQRTMTKLRIVHGLVG